MPLRDYRIWRHLILEEPQDQQLWYPRFFWHIRRRGPRGEHEVFGGHVEFVLSTPQPQASFRFHVGTRGSETPFDGHLGLLGTTLYWGLNQGGWLADRITQIWFNRLPNRLKAACLDDVCDCPMGPGRYKRHRGDLNGRYDGRDIAIRIDDGKVWWELWTRTGSWTKGQFARWRSGCGELNPLNWIWGEPRYWYESEEVSHLRIDLAENSYGVIATLQRQLHGRPKSKRRRMIWVVDVVSREGIPNRFDHSGGWKGDRVHGFAVGLAERRRDWQADAKAAIESRILADRARTGFRKPLPVQ